MSVDKLGLSPKALQLISERPRLWEYRLFGQVMADDVERVNNLFKQGYRPNGLEKVEIDSTIEYILIWLSNKIDELQSIITELSNILYSNHDDAFGPPGIPGNPENIVSYSRKIVSFYYRAIVLLQSIRNTSVNSDCNETHKEFALAVIDIITSIGTFGSNILRQIDDVMNAPVTDEKRVLNLEFTLKIRDSFTDALNRLTTKESENLSKLKELMSIAAEHMEKNGVQSNTINPGYIYVLTNPSIQDIVKIGKTQRSPDERAKELSLATGVPTPFIVVYQSYFSDCDKAEIFIHTKLDKYRVVNNREFFKVAIPIAIDCIIEAKNYFSQSENRLDSSGITQNANVDNYLGALAIDGNKPAEPGKELFDLGDAYYYGLNDTIQDYDEAFKYYQKAARLGYTEAFLQMGIMCHLGEGRNVDNKLALAYFKEAIRHGNDEGWAEMAKIYNSEGYKENEAKCWNKYFSSKNFLQFSLRRQRCVYNYISTAITENKPIEYKDQIREIKNEVLEFINIIAKVSKDRGLSSLLEKQRQIFIIVKEL